MKILFTLTYYYPHWTGLTKYCQRLAEGLASRGHQISVLTSQHKKNLLPQEKINGVQVFRVPVVGRISRSLIMPGFLFKLWQQVKKNDIVVVYLPMAEVLLIALVAKILNKPLYLVHNGDLVLPKGLFNRILEEVYYLNTSLSIRLSRKVIIYTKDYANHSKLLLRHKNKWQEIWPLFAVARPVSFKKEEWERVKNKKLVGFSGRFVEEKGIDILLKAMPLVLKKMPEAHFVFAGEYKISYENFYERNSDSINKLKNNITFFGLLNEEKLAFFYRNIDLLVLPSRTECLGSVQVEAMLAEVPVVATDIPGARQIVKRTGMGIVVFPENPKALAEGIISVLRNREKYLKPEKEIEKIFDYQKTLDNYEAVFANF